MSDTTTIYQGIIAFQKSMPVIKKTEANPFFKSKYADLANIQKQIQRPLSESGLGYVQTTVESGLETMLFNSTGETIKFTYPVNLTGKAQEIGSAITYAKRYSLVALLGLIIEGDDDDGNEAQQQPKAAPQQSQDDRPWLDDKTLGSALKWIEDGNDKAILKTRMATYKISKVNRAKLEEALNN